MTVYVDFEFYTDMYLGTSISESAFPQTAMRASKVIDQLTFGRAEAIITAAEDDDMIEAIQMATCAVADEIQRQNSADGGKELASERVGNFSQTYVVNKDMQKTNFDKQSDSARLYLWNTGLMYRGFSEDEYPSHIVR